MFVTDETASSRENAFRLLAVSPVTKRLRQAGDTGPTLRPATDSVAVRARLRDLGAMVNKLPSGESAFRAQAG
jgi:hypothetical protein